MFIDSLKSVMFSFSVCLRIRNLTYDQVEVFGVEEHQRA